MMRLNLCPPLWLLLPKVIIITSHSFLSLNNVSEGLPQGSYSLSVLSTYSLLVKRYSRLETQYKSTEWQVSKFQNDVILSLTFPNFDLAPKRNEKFGHCSLDLV